ncbi:hypothetical protein OSB04_011763 [Centaurea solstitialis]|uniref:Integrase catalytic domain-containing protein n=1 Tax=Centaurea solstitialis TaxID=347529 RepID=A0AA38WPF9_9ASTR|nr:hypothetical protein OSB04_011763 [Centaurea solstitialis]
MSYEIEQPAITEFRLQITSMLFLSSANSSTSLMEVFTSVDRIRRLQNRLTSEISNVRFVYWFVICLYPPTKRLAQPHFFLRGSSLLVHERKINEQEDKAKEEQTLKAGNQSTWSRANRGRGRGRGNYRGIKGRYHNDRGNQQHLNRQETQFYGKGRKQEVSRQVDGDQINFVENEEEISLLMVCHVKEETRQNMWYLEISCNNHMSGEKEAFSELDKSFRISVKFGDHSKIPVMGKGMEILHTLLPIFFVPDLMINMLNGDLLQGMGYEIHTKDGVNMTANRMFPLDRYNTSHLCLSTKLDDEAWLWHFHYGHLNFGGLKILWQKNMVTGLPQLAAPSQLSEECVVSKQYHNQFPHRRSWRAKKALKLVHSDICRPITPHSNGVGKKIIVLRTDRGGEYNSHEFSSFCDEQGIKRQLTAAYTTQHNGVCERKNRTIMNMVRSLLTSGPQVVFKKVLDQRCKLEHSFVEMKSHTCSKVVQSSASIFILQKKYLGEILAKKYIEGRKVDDTLYKQIVRSLMFLTATRPDIMYYVSTKEFGLFYKKGEKSKLFGFMDSDYPRDVDDRKSTSGYAFVMGT